MSGLSDFFSSIGDEIGTLAPSIASSIGGGFGGALATATIGKLLNTNNTTRSSGFFGVGDTAVKSTVGKLESTVSDILNFPKNHPFITGGAVLGLGALTSLFKKKQAIAPVQQAAAAATTRSSNLSPATLGTFLLNRVRSSATRRRSSRRKSIVHRAARRRTPRAHRLSSGRKHMSWVRSFRRKRR